MVGRSNRRGWGYLRRLPSGRWQASYVGPDLRRHTAHSTFTAKMDGEAWLADERRLVERDEWTPPAQRRAARQGQVVTVGQFAQTWVAQRNLRHRTREHYQAILARHLAPLSSVPLTGLTAAQVRSWHATLDPGHPTIRAHSYSLLHAVLSTAVSDGLIERNPCQIRGAQKARRRREPVVLDVAEVAALAEAITDRYRALVLLASWCGLRWGEVTELRRKDVSAGAEAVSVTRAVVHRGRACVIGPPKSGRTRTTITPPHIRADLLRHLNEFVADGPEALLFAPARGGHHLLDKVFAPHYGKALTEIGRDGAARPRPVIHDQRHFAGTMTARVGTLRENMDRLGHSTVAASLIYQGQISGRDAAVAEALSALAREEQ